jgi:hypothetical protein
VQRSSSPFWLENGSGSLVGRDSMANEARRYTGNSAFTNTAQRPRESQLKITKEKKARKKAEKKNFSTL